MAATPAAIVLGLGAAVNTWPLALSLSANAGAAAASRLENP